MATLNNTRDWYNDPASQPYHTDLDIAAANSQQAAIASGHPENALSAQQIAQQIGIESGYDTSAVSKKGATGIAQIMPSTAKDPGYGIGTVDPNDPHAAIQWAGTYDGTLGVKRYSNGGYDVSYLSTPSGTKLANGSTIKASDVSDSDMGIVTNSDGTVTHITDDSVSTGDGSSLGTFGKALADATGSKGGTGLTGLVAGGEEIFTRIVVVGIGLLLIFGGLIMFKPVQNAVATVKP